MLGGFCKDRIGNELIQRGDYEVVDTRSWQQVSSADISIFVARSTFVSAKMTTTTVDGYKPSRKRSARLK